VDLRVLGKVEIQNDESIFTLNRTAERCVLATLAFSPARPVHIDVFIENLWEDRPPAKADQTIATYVRRVRRLIEQAGGHRDWVRNRRPRSYELQIDPTMVDYHRFTASVASARASARAGDRRATLDAYQRALREWRGEPLADIDTSWAVRRRYALQGEYLDAVCGMLDEQLAAGDHATVVAGITKLIDHVVPTDRLIALAMHGLANSGQQAMIPDFIDRATEMMWNSAQVRPGKQIHALARALTNQPELTNYTLPPTPTPPGLPEEGPVTSAPDDPKDVVTMIAVNNDIVFQTARDQHIA
jgi:DNA-binding SARP family transcriptional activator